MDTLTRRSICPRLTIFIISKELVSRKSLLSQENSFHEAKYHPPPNACCPPLGKFETIGGKYADIAIPPYAMRLKPGDMRSAVSGFVGSLIYLLVRPI